ncbi:MAG: Histidinol dehydrogenase [Alphaproteobacteria bacterium MarineAlpha5_Bin5]|nr:MAG: Histidinol dehydrogenase [Alphaproteobacteria bacterium MarineAlpha5_Bin5]PPR51938.1 MAG: Histidinol dehydrogenase [Alphaproteobacteria bacterium MarineAlpha5_Bin4]|tara:strand:- start:20674 stop:21960 length:1287 start_codon:yes stop_codon:yes gene_type:complete
MKILNYNNENFFNELKSHLLKRLSNTDNKIDNIVKNIILDVKENGDIALIKYAKNLDNVDLSQSDIKLRSINKLYSKDDIDDSVILSFKKAIKNIKKFHENQIPQDYEMHNDDNVKLSLHWKPIESVGLYIPGGKAVYPSSLIMNVIPAKVAGVKRIVCVTPPSKKINPYILKLLEELEIYEIYLVGGAQAIAALTYGTKTIKPVNKIFGPGNAFVNSAKKQVFGNVGIDLFAGPSEIVVVADDENNPSWVASDLMAQAEHDDSAQSILITDSEEFVAKVRQEIKNLSYDLSKKNTIYNSLEINGLFIVIDNLKDSANIVNFIAPEHLHLQSKHKDEILANIINSGSIFLGEYSCEAFGDYIVGTNHILPTSGSARFSSGLGVLDFMKRNTVIEMNKQSYNNCAKDVEQMAKVEGLDAHKLSVKIRQI